MLLQFGNFIINEDCMHYAGDEAHYYIYKTKRGGFTLVVCKLDADGEITDTRYGCMNLSTAIQCIEEIENGQEI
jgi:hypothetical protein